MACQDVRKLPGGFSGPAELAGILVGDVILGINYKPLEKGLVHTSTRLAEAIALSGFVKLQVSQRDPAMHIFVLSCCVTSALRAHRAK